MLIRILLFGANYRLISLLLLAAMTALAVTGLPKLRIDSGFSRLISDGNPDKPHYDRIIQQFGSDNRTVIPYKTAWKQPCRKSFQQTCTRMGAVAQMQVSMQTASVFILTLTGRMTRKS